MRTPARRQATAILALVAMAIVVVAGMLHVSHAMAANAPRAVDPHAWCGLDADHAPADNQSGIGHCPACALAKSLALATLPLVAVPAPRPGVATSAPRRHAAVLVAFRHEITARPRAPPPSPETPSHDG